LLQEFVKPSWLKTAESVPGVQTQKMRKIMQATSVLLIFVGAVLLSQKPAYAYADPGTGLLAIQAAGSALIAAGWYMRRKIYSLFHRSADDVRQSEESPTENQDESSTFR
jgi:hypothetical protein